MTVTAHQTKLASMDHAGTLVIVASMRSVMLSITRLYANVYPDMAVMLWLGAQVIHIHHG